VCDHPSFACNLISSEGLSPLGLARDLDESSPGSQAVCEIASNLSMVQNPGTATIRRGMAMWLLRIRMKGIAG